MKSVTEVPFNRLLDLQPSADHAKLLQLPAGPQYLNHLGTVHASAQLALAEATSGEFLLHALSETTLREDAPSGDLKSLVPVVRRLTSKFRQPARGRLTSSATATDGLDSLRADLQSKGRAFLTVQVEIHDESGAHTLSASVEWFVTRG